MFDSVYCCCCYCCWDTPSISSEILVYLLEFVFCTCIYVEDRIGWLFPNVNTQSLNFFSFFTILVYSHCRSIYNYTKFKLQFVLDATQKNRKKMPKIEVDLFCDVDKVKFARENVLYQTVIWCCINGCIVEFYSESDYCSFHKYSNIDIFVYMIRIR